MKVFVATSEGQGSRSSDFFNSKEDELVFFSAECGSDMSNVDGSCGCRRCMDDSEGNGTTTFKVEDLEITREGYFEKHIECLIKSGRFSAEEVEDDLEYHRQEAKILLQAAEIFPVGEILEKRGMIFNRVRSIISSAKMTNPKKEI